MRYLAAFIVLFVGQLPLSAELVGVVNGSTSGARLQRGGQTYQPVAGSQLQSGDGVNISRQGGLSYRTTAGDYIVLGGPSSLTLSQGSLTIPGGIVRAVVRHALTLQMGNHRLDANRGVFEISTLNGTATISVAAGTGKLTLSDQTTYDLVAGEMVEIDAEGGLTVVQRDPRLQQRMQEIMLTIAGATSRKLRGTQLDAVAQSEDMQSQNDYTLDFDTDESSNQQFASSNTQDQQTQDSTTRSQDAVAIAGSPTLNLPSLGGGGATASTSNVSTANFARSAFVDISNDDKAVLGTINFITAEQVARLGIKLLPGELTGDTNLTSKFWSVGELKPGEFGDLTNFDVTALQSFDSRDASVDIRKAKDAFLVPTTNLVLVDFGDLRKINPNNTGDPADPEFSRLNFLADSFAIKVIGNPQKNDLPDGDDRNETAGAIRIGPDLRTDELNIEDDIRFSDKNSDGSVNENAINPLLSYAFGNFRFTQKNADVEIATRRSDQDRSNPADKNLPDQARKDVKFERGDPDVQESVPKEFNDLPTSIQNLPRDLRAAFTVATAESLKSYARRTNQTRFVIDGKLIDITGYKPRN